MGHGFYIVFAIFLLFTNLLTKAYAVNNVHFITPFTSSEDLKPCSAYINEQEQYKKAFRCSSTVMDLKGKEFALPKCYVLLEGSPDVQTNSKYSCLVTGVVVAECILGFYDDDTRIIFIVYSKKTRDIEKTYRHELQHYFLDLISNNADAPHAHKVWKTCEPRYGKRG